MYTLVVSGYNYHGKPIHDLIFNLSRREAKVIASYFYNPEYPVKCTLIKSRTLFYSGR